MGGGGSKILQPIVKATGINEIGKAVDRLVPEAAKKINDKMTPEWLKGAGQSIGLNNETMGLPNAEGITAGEEGVTKQDMKDEAAGVANAKVDAKRQAIARSRSIFTSPLGLGGFAGLARKLLLGE